MAGRNREGKWTRKANRGGSMRCFMKFIPPQFSDSNNDGIGDLNGITSKLDYLKDLGVAPLGQCRVVPSPEGDSEYDVSDYEAIDRCTER